MVHNSYIFININSWHTAYTIALKTGTYFDKERDFLQGSCYVNTFKGPSNMLFLFKLYITLYFRASFQLFSNILTSFRRGDFIPTEILNQIRQSFCKCISKSFIQKLSDFTFASDFSHEKNSLFGTFYFRNQLIWQVSKKKKQKF